VHTESARHIIRTRNGKNTWQHEDIGVTTRLTDDGLLVELSSPQSAVRYVELRWQQRVPEGMKYLGDHWERGYGDLSWTGMTPDKPMPWYFFVFDGTKLFGCGVKTGAQAFCSWHVDPHGVTLWMDVRSGGVGVMLGQRTITMATVVERLSQENESTYEAASHFTAMLCDKPLLPDQPVYGANNCYYDDSYDHRSTERILQDSKLLADLAGNHANRPFSIIDDGWENATRMDVSPWENGNERFPDMAALAGKIKKIGARPGIWYRPLLANQDVPKSWTLETRQPITGQTILDPTIPEVLERIKQDVARMADWGYELIKYSDTTHDALGLGAMGNGLTEDGWQFSDRSKTNAEILTEIYRSIRSAADKTLLVGCNTVGHLCAGYVHVQRIGDNTSGKEWLRTRKMGINSLAFRAMQHGHLFATDADCVGLTSQIPWRLNEQWMELLAASGTSMFVSTQPTYVKEKQKAALSRAYARASRPQRLVQPLDWIENACPSRWKSGEEFFEFNWWNA
jgi:alpha-galactosidase